MDSSIFVDTCSCGKMADSCRKGKCKNCYNKLFREYRKNNPKIFRRLDRKYQLKTKYGITEDKYVEMYDSQKGLCKICGVSKSLLCIDHDHATGKVRALLCNYCNVVVGNLERKDINKFLDYINEHLNIR